MNVGLDRLGNPCLGRWCGTEGSHDGLEEEHFRHKEQGPEVEAHHRRPTHHKEPSWLRAVSKGEGAEGEAELGPGHTGPWRPR